MKVRKIVLMAHSVQGRIRGSRFDSQQQQQQQWVFSLRHNQNDIWDPSNLLSKRDHGLFYEGKGKKKSVKLTVHFHLVTNSKFTPPHPFTVWFFFTEQFVTYRNQ
jgi:hypothetical protein